MRLLTKDRADLIEALEAESDLGRVTTSKNEHLTDALRAVFALKFECVKLVFCGGTSLSKAHGLIERMSMLRSKAGGSEAARLSEFPICSPHRKH